MAVQLLTAAALVATCLAAPSVKTKSCSVLHAQCGGPGWTGPTCCAAGSTCTSQSLNISRCESGRTSTSIPLVRARDATETGASNSSASTGGGGGGGSTTWSGNPIADVQLWANSYWANEITTLTIPNLPEDQASAAAKAAKVPTFQWLDTAAKVPLMVDTLKEIGEANKGGASPPYAAQFVVYDLPDRDCAAAASNGEYSIADDGVTKYKAYIDSIKKNILDYPDIRIILVIEPDSLANMVTNQDVPKCAGAKSAYLESIDYALKELNLPNVASYLDSGHGGWTGWPLNLDPAAKLFSEVYKNAGSPASLRGLATNVANYNAWTLTTAPPYTTPNPNFDEQRYVTALAPLLKSAGWDAHFVTDQGRAGVQPTKQQKWGDWCNVAGTGFGLRPTAETGNELLDAILWIKPGGESDGTSDESSSRYDLHCGLADALKPAPEAGTWFHDYFVQLLTNANPPFT